MYKYPGFIQINNIYSLNIKENQYTHRYLLKIPFEDKCPSSGKILFIMKNPSIADKEGMDTTTRNIVYYVNELRKLEGFKLISEISIINLFSLVATNSSDLLNIINKYGQYSLVGTEYDSFIKKEIEESLIIVPSWGNKPKNFTGSSTVIYRKRIHDILNILNNINKSNIYLIGDSKQRTKYPKHPQYIGYKTKELIQKWMLNSYQVKGEYLIKGRNT